MFAIPLASSAKVLPASVCKLCIAVLAMAMPRGRSAAQPDEATRVCAP